jgi:hypothetical protein
VSRGSSVSSAASRARCSSRSGKSGASAGKLVHASMAVPPQVASTMPTGTSRARWISRAKK